MSTNPDDQKTQLTDMVKAVGAVLGVALALFTVVNSIIAQPITSLVVALIAAALVSAWLVLSRWVSITQVITAWLALAIVVLAGFVIWPRTMTVEGVIYDTVGNPVRNEQVILFDRSGRRYETKTDAEGYYQFIDVPSGKYRVQVRTNQVEGETKGILVRVVQQNLTVSEITLTAAPTSVAVVISDTPTATLIPLPNTPYPTQTPHPTSTPIVIQAPPSPTPVVVTATPTPYGDQLVYCARIGSSHDYDLVLLDLQSMERVTLARVIDSEPGPTWSPDGNQVIFVSKVKGYSQLHLLDLMTGHQRLLTDSPCDKGQPSWSPDGSYVVYSVMHPNDDMDLFIWDLQRNKELQLTGYPDIIEIWGPKWSPDGRAIAFWSNLTFYGQHYETYLLAFPPRNLPQTDPNDLYLWSTEPASGPDDDEQFVWSPDGKRFAFINKADNASRRYFDILVGEFDLAKDLDKWAPEDGTLFKIPDYEQVFEAAPVWSPDSTRVAFHRVVSGDPYTGNKDIIVFDLKTYTSENVTQTPNVDDRWPAWRPRKQW